MSYEILVSKIFEKQFKKLSKKFPSLKNEIKNLLNSLKTHPFQGTSLGHSCYKIRLGIKSKRKGKQRGGRIITYVFVKKKEVYLLSIYDKSKRTNITDKELKMLLDFLTE